MKEPDIQFGKNNSSLATCEGDAKIFNTVISYKRQRFAMYKIEGINI